MAPPKAIATIRSHDAYNGRTLYINEAGGEPEMLIPPDATFSLLPTSDREGRDVISIVGASGGGKSYLAKGLAEEYKRMWPERRVYVISALSKDSTLDSMRDDRGRPFLKRLNVASFVEEALERDDVTRDFKHSLVIADDCEALGGAERAAVNSILTALLTLGRHSATSVIVCSHLPARGKETALLLSESTMFVLFPNSLGNHVLRYLCERHIGLNPKETAALKAIRSRWVALSRGHPRYLIASNEARVL